MTGALNAIEMDAADIAHVGVFESFLPKQPIAFEAGLIFVHAPSNLIFVLVRIDRFNLYKWKFVCVPHQMCERNNLVGKTLTYQDLIRHLDMAQTMPESLRVRSWRINRKGEKELVYYPFNRCNPYTPCAYCIGQQLEWKLPPRTTYAKYLEAYKVSMGTKPLYTLGEGYIPAVPFTPVVLHTKDLTKLKERRRANAERLCNHREDERAKREKEVTNAQEATTALSVKEPLKTRHILVPEGGLREECFKKITWLREIKMTAGEWLHAKGDRVTSVLFSQFLFMMPYTYQGLHSEIIPSMDNIHRVIPLGGDRYALYASFTMDGCNIKDLTPQTIEVWVLHSRLLSLYTILKEKNEALVEKELCATPEHSQPKLPMSFLRVMHYAHTIQSIFEQSDLSKEDAADCILENTL